MAIDFSGIIRALEVLQARMRTQQLTLQLGLFINKFTNLPTVKVPVSSALSDLIQTIGEGASEVAGTLVQLQESTSIVVLNMQQYETIKKVLGIFPKVVEGINARLEYVIALRKIGAEILEKTGEPLSLAVGLLIPGITFISAGAFLLGGIFGLRMSFQKPQNEENKPRQWTSFIFPGILLTLGASCMALSALIMGKVAGNCRTLAEAFGKTPL